MSADRLRSAATALRSGRREVSPAVALALADWLDAEAERVEEGALAILFDGSSMFPPNEHALTLADTILGGKS